MASSKGLKRLAFFVVFLIPVGWYLFLQLFGSNTFNLTLLSPIADSCFQHQDISIVYRSDSVEVSQQNYFDRAQFKANHQNVAFVPDTSDLFGCIQNDQDLLLVNEEGLWGSYDLSREGVDQLLTELDILLIQKSYGKGTSR